MAFQAEGKALKRPWGRHRGAGPSLEDREGAGGGQVKGLPQSPHGYERSLWLWHREPAVRPEECGALLEAVLTPGGAAHVEDVSCLAARLWHRPTKTRQRTEIAPSPEQKARKHTSL